MSRTVRHALLGALALLATAAPARAQRPSPVQCETPRDPAAPTLFHIGDSTVRNGNGTGANGEWGWGDLIAVYPPGDSIIDVSLNRDGMKAGRPIQALSGWGKDCQAAVAGDFSFSADGASYDTGEVLKNCLEMESYYAAKSVGTTRVSTGRS